MGSAAAGARGVTIPVFSSLGTLDGKPALCQPRTGNRPTVRGTSAVAPDGKPAPALDVAVVGNRLCRTTTCWTSELPLVSVCRQEFVIAIPVQHVPALQTDNAVVLGVGFQAYGALSVVAIEL